MADLGIDENSSCGQYIAYEDAIRGQRLSLTDRFRNEADLGRLFREIWTGAALTVNGFDESFSKATHALGQTCRAYPAVTLKAAMTRADYFAAWGKWPKS